ncbi:preprotein translocase subunit SecE [Succinatimonas hippei]|uniref:Protein translocase subunit SecE n=1 Tax=Succinatimonas hippei (strain DSM 22608 / JCM 16073 / KCTC 15190 / YIT 12066) TaxID=762983 RepID=E8LJV3_SUCHY|nr:preprotein translocase subunit SecE [Succinatimonas hippei]EFY07183.1 preprotein translocase, SecE subunit [Succinatimonas hippei YIT 12066]MDM8121103.1 preprotein translocase subunit SecE [Succinatimonas hippei]
MSENKSTKTQNAAINTAAPAKAKAPVKAANKKAAAQFVSTPLDRLLWLCAIVLVGGAIFGNFYYTQHIVIDESSLGRFGRTAIVIAVIIAGLAVTLFTNKGHALLTFAREAYVELRKVVWPTRQEAVQTTIIVFVGVCVVSLFLYLCDLVFLQVVKAITL